jgi:hypothetical protein
MWEITDSTIEEIIINIVSDSCSTEWSDDEKENKKIMYYTESWPQLIIYRQFLTVAFLMSQEKH